MAHHDIRQKMKKKLKVMLAIVGLGFIAFGVMPILEHYAKPKPTQLIARDIMIPWCAFIKNIIEIHHEDLGSEQLSFEYLLEKISDRETRDTIIGFKNDFKKNGIMYLPPSINSSSEEIIAIKQAYGYASIVTLGRRSFTIKTRN
jgi:hypothetical protein